MGIAYTLLLRALTQNALKQIAAVAGAVGIHGIAAVSNSSTALAQQTRRRARNTFVPARIRRKAAAPPPSAPSVMKRGGSHAKSRFACCSVKPRAWTK